jgi:hypothetical protein
MDQYLNILLFKKITQRLLKYTEKILDQYKVIQK